jgi:hypothetical protein
VSSLRWGGSQPVGSIERANLKSLNKPDYPNLFTWGQKQIQLPKHVLLEITENGQGQKPTNPKCDIPMSEPFRTDYTVQLHEGFYVFVSFLSYTIPLTHRFI